MRYRTKRPFRWNRLIWALFGVSVVGLFLPEAITGRLMNLVQVLVPFQAGATRVADRVGDALGADPASVSSAEHEGVVREARALRHAVAALSSRVAQLTEANRQLTALRQGGLGPDGVLIPARLVADDLLAWRDSGLLDAGTLRGVRRNAPVTTRALSLDAGSDDGVSEGMMILAGEVLVGWVAHVGTHTARVMLLSDPTCRMPVAIGRIENGTFRRLPTEDPAEFWLAGAGGGRLEIIDVDHRYVEDEPGRIRVGDTVISSPDDPTMPLALTIGTITHLEPDPDNGLLFTLTVETAVPERIRRVYVLASGNR